MRKWIAIAASASETAAEGTSLVYQTLMSRASSAHVPGWAVGGGGWGRKVRGAARA